MDLAESLRPLNVRLLLPIGPTWRPRGVLTVLDAANCPCGLEFSLFALQALGIWETMIGWASPGL